MIELAEKLNLDVTLVKKLKKLSDEKDKRVERVAENCFKNGFSCLDAESDIMRLAVILKCAEKLKEKYDYYGISEDIYYDTLSDIKIWCDKNNNKGLLNYRWIKNHISFRLFKLGRLQFQFYECKNKTLFYNKLPFEYGEKLIYIHVPEGEKLQKEKCIDSIRCANEFFKKYFPDYNYRFYFCESWLLFDGNRNFMPDSSNIMQFASLFEHAYSINFDKQAIERIFGKRRWFIKNYPEKTSLQKRTKQYLKEKGTLGLGVGTIDKSTVV